MKNKNCILLLLISSFALSSCNGGYDLKKPNGGIEVSEATITLADGSKATIKKGMNEEEYLPILASLNNINVLSVNCDMNFTLAMPKNYYSAKSKVRFTNDGEKRGWYYLKESGTVSDVIVSTSADAVAYNSFSYVKENGKYVSFYGCIPSESTRDAINSMREQPILFEDPDYDSGYYTKEGLPLTPPPEQTSNGIRSCSMLHSFLQMYPCYSVSRMMQSPKYGSYQLDTTISYKITKKYLILNFDNPYGILDTIGPTNEIEVVYATSVGESCYLKSEMYYELDSGKLAYCEAKFKTAAFPTWRNVVLTGSLIIKTQKESDEGYNKFLEIRKEIMSQYTEKR